MPAGKVVSCPLVDEVFVRLRRGRWPLSKGLLVEALLPLGVPTEVAHALAHTVEERLKRLRRKGGVTPRRVRPGKTIVLMRFL